MNFQSSDHNKHDHEKVNSKRDCSTTCRDTHPRSRSDLSWLFVRRRGSPLPSAATASSSSNGGIINKSRKLFFDFLLVPTLEALIGPDDNTLIVDDAVVVDEIG